MDDGRRSGSRLLEDVWLKRAAMHLADGGALSPDACEVDYRTQGEEAEILRTATPSGRRLSGREFLEVIDKQNRHADRWRANVIARARTIVHARRALALPRGRQCVRGFPSRSTKRRVGAGGRSRSRSPGRPTADDPHPCRHNHRRKKRP